MGQKVTLGGQHLDAEFAIEWGLISGVDPYQTTVQIDAGEAAQFLPKGAPVGQELIIKDDGGKTMRYQNVFVLGEVASSQPYQRRILLSDRRWLWNRIHILGRYNIRRRTGDKRLLDEGSDPVPLEIAQFVDEFFYAPWSTEDGDRWGPKSMLLDVIAKMRLKDPFSFTIPRRFVEEFPINDLDMDDPAPVALEKALEFLPGTDVFVDKDGRVVFYGSLGGQEAFLLPNTGPEIVGGGHVRAEKISFAPTRPKKFIFYYTREHELRFDNVQEGSSRAANRETRDMENVLVVSDPILTLANGQQEARGTYIIMEEAFAAWNADPVFGPLPGIPDWSHTQVQEAFFEDALFNQYVPWGSDVPQPIEAGRVNAIKSYYRQTYKINRRWMDRIYALRAYRATILDLTTGRQGVARAYSDYAIEVSSRNISTDPNFQFFHHNITGFATLIKDAQVAPAAVTVQDEQVGIINLDYRVDLYGRVKQVWPSRIVNFPTANIGDPLNPTCLNERTPEGLFPKLEADHRVAVILTAVPAAPNSKKQLFRVEIFPKDVKDLIPGFDVGESNGPEWEVRIGSGVLTARFAWSDDKADAIERAFGIDVPAGVAGDVVLDADAESLRPLLINENDLIEYSLAKATELWASMTDRHLGTRTVRLNPDLSPVGALERVIHGMSTDGTATSRIEIREQLKKLRPEGLLSDSTRRTILREVIPRT